ncbi:hypothetical protein SASPL_140135 [Salvia splendens]|uniref:Uncharacterized protein n=1 Tax=Salvia splendens TaxID=180675 RepID=A0A8X8ZBN5_SALSN|nr:hypothetical protein SASPL_140135 [Salvia splendens]
MENEAAAEYHDAYEHFTDKPNENAIIAKDEDFGEGDDVCPICLDTFTIPCKSNWGCVLQLWMYRYSIQPCKCPLCCCRIVNLEVQPSEEADNGGRVRKEVQHYNGLYIPGLFGSLHLFLGFVYELLEFEFLPTGTTLV